MNGALLVSLTNIIARAALRSRRYLSLYFSFWFLRWTFLTLGLCSEELVGEGKAVMEAAEPELDMVVWGGEPRKDWVGNAARDC